VRKSETFPALNGLRFLAAFAVVIFHYSPRVDVYTRLNDFVKNMIDQGPCAVSFFFILSGFLLGYRNLAGSSHQDKASDFYWSRFVRLYPVYLLAFLLFLPVAAQRYPPNPPPGAEGNHTFIFSAVLSCLMLQSWTPLAQAWNGPSWSLSVEAFLYFVFPFVALRASKLSRLQATALFVGSWLVPSGLAIAYVAHWIPDRTWHLYLTNDPLLWTPLFLMGICASRMVSGWKNLPERNAQVIWALGCLALILICLSWPHRWNDVLVTGGIAPLLAAIILFCTRPSCWIARVLGARSLSKLGEASYAIYILQAPLWHYWQPFTNYLRHAPLQTNVVAPWQFAGFVVFLVLASMGVQRFVEVPARAALGDWRARNFKRPGHQHQRAAPAQSPAQFPARVPADYPGESEQLFTCGPTAAIES
jgi:peptidoglycan/LPS O-acetylase OafA/YrhL